MSQTGFGSLLPQFPLHLQFSGQEDCPPGHSFGPKVREHFLFVNVVSGKGIYAAEGGTFRLGEGDSFLMAPGRLGYYEADAADPWSYRWVGFGGTHAAALLARAGFAAARPVLSHSYQGELSALFGALFGLDGDPESREWAGTGILYQMLALLHREWAPERERRGPAGSLPNGYIRQAVQYMDHAYSEPLRIAGVAAHVGLERSYFTKLFRQHTGRSPQEHLLAVRLNKAALLLAETDLTVEQVAYSVGFNNLNHFSYTFSRTFGHPPSRHRGGGA